jgi:hypothetical protein
MMTFVFCSKSGAKDAKSQLRHSLGAKDMGGGHRDKIQVREKGLALKLDRLDLHSHRIPEHLCR